MLDSTDFSGLTTEAINPATTDIDALSTAELVQTLHAENHLVAAAVDTALAEIASAVDVIAERIERGGRMLYVGAGTSGRLGVLDASECPPTFGVPADVIQGIIAGGDSALRNSIEGAEDDDEAGAQAIRDRGIGPNDVVVGIAASGRTPFVIGALEAGRRAGAYTIGVVNVPHSKIGTIVDTCLAAETGPEPLTGSTRLKAGTAQKLILNLVSTAVMVRLGKTYRNLMVDVQATNEKLRDRAVRIVAEAAGVNDHHARAALGQSGWHAKTAIVALKLGISAESARERLQETKGRIRPALEVRL
jgi:N-acetylmuramic acid 6-phosphate etherase